MHDLSIFVGRKYYDGAGIEENGREVGVEEVLSDPLKICFGKLP